MDAIMFKKGDTFRLSCTYAIDGVPSALPPGIRSQLRSPYGQLVAELSVAVVDAPNGLFDLTAPDTSSWPLDTLSQDIQYTDATGNVASTDTFTIQCVADVTHD